MSYSSPTPVDFSDRFVDIDFNREAEDTGNACGWIPDSDDDLAAATPFESVEDLIPEAEWKDRIAEIDASPDGWLERLIVHIFDQGSEPSCTHNASAQAQLIAQAKQHGPENVIKLSPMSSYRWNGSRWSGSSVAGALTWLCETGQLPARTPENEAHVQAGHFKHTHPFRGYGEPFMDGWKETAKMFSIRECLKITSGVKGWVSALIKGFLCVGGRDGHCIASVRPVWDGDICDDYVNSWRDSFGFKLKIATGLSGGFGRDSRRKIATKASRGGWAVRDVLVLPWWFDKTTK